MFVKNVKYIYRYYEEAVAFSKEHLSKGHHLHFKVRIILYCCHNPTIVFTTGHTVITKATTHYPLLPRVGVGMGGELPLKGGLGTCHPQDSLFEAGHILAQETHSFKPVSSFKDSTSMSFH